MKKKTWIAFLILGVVFALGTLAGISSSVYCLKSSFGEERGRDMDGDRNNNGRLVEHIERKMTRMLKLTPDQVEALRPVWVSLGDSFDQIHRNTRKEIRQLILDAQNEINPVLNDEQRERLKKRLNKMGHLFDSPPPPRHKKNRDNHLKRQEDGTMPQRGGEPPLGCDEPPHEETL